MICKECGAYNPDHATYCKVCAANLKGTPTPEAPEVHEEEQPTKRFSRPSWVVPTQTEPFEKAAPEPEPVEEAVEEAVEEEPIVEPIVEEEPVAEEEHAESDTESEEEAPELWTPVRARRSQYSHGPEAEEETEEDSEDSQEEPAETENDENEGIYNEEEALEDADDSFEYEPTPPKRKQQKKKSNTMFTVLLIAIIVVIIGILVAGGLFIYKKLTEKNKSNTPDAGASQTSEQTENNEPESILPSEPTDSNNPAPTAAPVVDDKNAELQKYIDNGTDHVAITVKIPAYATVTIDFPHQTDYEFVNNDAQALTRKVKIPVAVFYPNEPLTESTREITPDITITTADGGSYKVNCPSFTCEFPKLNISVGSPIPNEDGMIMAPESNEVKISGTIDDPGAEITIDGVGVQVYEGGMFVYDFKFKDDVGEDDVETIKIVAQKNNFVTDEKEVTIHAYKFIPEPMTLEVNTEGSALRADKNGKLTVSGNTLPGATLTAMSDNTTNVLCGSVTVDGDGNFSFQVTMESTFYGMSVITLDAVKEGAESGSTKFTVLKGFADKESFLKYYNKTKTYLEVTPKKTKISDLLANLSQYASSAYGIRVTASVVEVINKDGDIIVKMTVNKTNETIYVHNLSEKWAPADNVGSKYNLYCNLMGTYEDTGCCEFLCWFAKKP